MLVAFTRILKYGWRNFLRNGWLSVSTIGIMILALAVFEGLILFNVIGNGAVQAIQEKVDISVYFKSNVSEDSILNVKRSIENLEEVKYVEYVSRDIALKKFKETHADDEVITKTLDELGGNPLLASLNIKAKDLKEYEVIAAYIENADLKSVVEKVTYNQNQVVINRLTKFIDTARRIGFGLTIFLAFLATMVTFNTIRLAIFSNSEEIAIMRLVGATNSFIRRPYMVEGVLYGSIAAIVSFLLLIPLVSFVSPKIAEFVPEVNLANYFKIEYMSLLMYQFLFGIGLGIVSSVIAIRRYLHV